MSFDENDKKSTTLTLQPDESMRIPESIGNYKVLEVIGRGGMGTVYLAQQEKPIKRKVAIKVVKPGMDSKEILARFESEQQALALMNHLNIAQVYESGITEQGYSYFVMEYVPGEPITKHCDKYKQGIDERLGLFLDLCDAVQHAHYKGIVHRDIKPTNVLVAFRENKHIPKIIDFGVAKALTGQGLTEKTMHTRHGIAVGTPLYMSPEQAELTGYDIDTRTDIYSLGVLLYEMLVGAVPFSEEELQRAGVLEILRVIREKEPIKPSTRFDLMKDKTSEIAKNRGTFESNLKRKLRGDLDWIVMKAMEKDRRRRYSTAGELAADISRFLNKEAIKARPASLVYKTKKFVRKHKAASLSAAVILSMIIISYLWNMGEMRKAEKSAKEANYNFAIALKESAKAFSRENRWQLVKLFSISSLLYQNKAQKYLDMSDIQIPIGYKNWRLILNSNTPISNLIRSNKARGGMGWTISHEGNYFAASGSFENPRLKIWDTYSGKEILAGDPPLSIRFNCMKFGANEKYIAVALLQAIEILDIPNGKLVATFEVPGNYLRLIVISDDGNLLAVKEVAGALGWDKIQIWDIKKNEKISELGRLELSGSGFCLSPMNRYIASGGFDKSIKVWELPALKEVCNVPGEISDQSKRRGDIELSFSPDEKYIASGNNDGIIRVWEIKNGNELLKLKGHQGQITSMDFSPDGKFLVSRSRLGEIKIWDLQIGEEMTTLQGANEDLNESFPELFLNQETVNFNRNGDRLICCTRNKIRIWEASSARQISFLNGHRYPVITLDIKPEENRLISGSSDGSLKTWDFSTGKIVSSVGKIEANSNLFAVNIPKNFYATINDKLEIKIMDLSSEEKILNLDLSDEDTLKGAISISANGAYLAAGKGNGDIEIWGLSDGKFKNFLSNHKSRVFNTCFSADGKLLASSDFREIKIWDIAKRMEIRKIIVESPGLPSLCLSPNSKLITCFAGKAVDIWEVSSGKRLAGFNYNSQINSIAFSPSGKILAFGCEDKSILILDIDENKLITSLKEPKDPITSIAFSSNGRFLAAGTKAGTVHVWEIEAILNSMWLKLDFPYREKDIKELLRSLEGEIGYRLDGLNPVVFSRKY